MVYVDNFQRFIDISIIKLMDTTCIYRNSKTVGNETLENWSADKAKCNGAFVSIDNIFSLTYIPIT